MTSTSEAGWNLECTYATLPSAFYAWATPTEVRQPKLLLLNQAVARRLGFNPDAMQDQVHAEIFAGNRLPPGARPLAQAYAGHQFGGFAMLGDGRALLLGEQVTPTGERWDVQLKGSGPTSFSRRGDGRAALGPMLREYIISQAMQALQIPTTLSLAVAATGEPVYRFRAEPGAVLCRIASSHIRVGTFQFAAARGNKQDLQCLADYVIDRHYPELRKQATEETSTEGRGPYLRLLQSVIQQQASLIAKWMSIGFIHGVMNTDNVSIAGETIDYGPCAMMNAYHPATVFSSIDDQGRYAYGNQPAICQWNLARFAETLIPLLHDDVQSAISIATTAVEGFSQLYQDRWLIEMAAKIGIVDARPEDRSLVQRLLDWMESTGSDFTNTFRTLSEVSQAAEVATDAVFSNWWEAWIARLKHSGLALPQAQQSMRRVNPAVIARNHLVEVALEAAVQSGDFGPMRKLLEFLEQPYSRPAGEWDRFCQPPEGGDRDYQTYCGT